MEWIIIGTIIGLMMGLTGAGGALVAIPLFMNLLTKSLKEATILSLYVVILASIINFISQRKEANYRLALLTFFGSIAGSLFTRPLKEGVPDVVIAGLLALVSVFTLFHLWKKKSSQQSGPIAPHPLKVLFLGLILGALTTMTGLGGGVLLIPILIGVFKLNETKAVATSLLTIALSSLVSLLLQLKDLKVFLGGSELAVLLIGIVFSLLGTKLLLKYVPASVISITRKVIFTIIVFYSLITIF